MADEQQDQINHQENFRATMQQVLEYMAAPTPAGDAVKSNPPPTKTDLHLSRLNDDQLREALNGLEQDWQVSPRSTSTGG